MKRKQKLDKRRKDEENQATHHKREETNNKEEKREKTGENKHLIVLFISEVWKRRYVSIDQCVPASSEDLWKIK